MKRKAKLRTYVTIKDKLQAEPYLHFKNRLARISLARLRGGTSFLRIETGRYEKEKPEERLCLWCSNAIEDEKHFLLECNLYRSIRQKTLEHLNLDATHPGRAELIRMMEAASGKVRRKKFSLTISSAPVSCANASSNSFSPLP